MGRAKKTWAITAVSVLGLLVLLLLLASSINWNFARPWLAGRIADATGRTATIDGDLEIHWRPPRHLYLDWRRHIPWPHFRAHRLSLGNPEWAQTGPTMLTVPQLDFTLNPLGLLRRSVIIPSLLLTEPNLMLEINEAGDNNWTFKQENSQSEWKIDLRKLFLDGATVRLLNRARPADVTARMQTRDDASVSFIVSGKVGGSRVRGGGETGPLLTLQEDEPFPVKVRVSIGESDIAIDGTATNPRAPTALDMKLLIQGASMADLFPFTGIALPHTPRFSTQGRLVGSLRPSDFLLRYEDFSGRVGASDLAGTLEYLRREPRPLLRGEMVSRRLDLGDLGTVFGAGEAKSDEEVLPERDFATDRWNAVDLKLRFSGKQIVRKGQLPLENVFADAELQDGVLHLKPLRFGFAGGSFTSDLTVTAADSLPQAKLQLTGRGIRLSELFPAIEGAPATVGEAQVNAQLSAAGTSIAELAASANGEVRAFVREGTISKLALEAVGLNLGSVIVTRLFGDRPVQVNCLASDFKVADGVMHARTFVVDTEDALVDIKGDINLGTESLALVIRPESKGPRVLALRSPLYIGGTFSTPEIGIDAGAVGVQAGVAAALGTLAAPLAALAALIDPGQGEESPCPKLLSRVQQAPEAAEK